MNQATKEFRQNIADEFVKALSENELEWKKNWSGGGCPANATTMKKYNGINRFKLMLIQLAEGLPDNRWATFKQIKDKGWKLKKGAKGQKVEYWQPYDFDNKKPITWKEFQENIRNPDRNVNLIAKYYYVFNGKDIEGIPELKLQQNREVVSDEIIHKISTGMEVSLMNDGNGQAFYRPSDDSIHLPEKESFFSNYDYNATVLHELSHATGAKHRLNRDIENYFGSEKYAYEELVAEISSCFMGEHLQIEQTDEHVKNHKAYVKSWISNIKEKPDALVRAIRDAGNAANLLEYHAGILSKEEYQKSLQESMEVSQEQVKEQKPEEKTTKIPEKPEVEQKDPLEKVFAECLEKNDTEGLKNILGKLPYQVKLFNTVFDASYSTVKGQSVEAKIGDYCITVGFHNTYDPRMAGEVRKPITQHIEAVICEKENVVKIVSISSLKSKSITNAQKNYEKMLEQWKAFTKQESITLPLNREHHLKCNGYRPTATLLKKMEMLDQLTGRYNTVKDIHTAFKEGTLKDNPEADKLVKSIGKIMQNQEIAKMPAAVPVR